MLNRRFVLDTNIWISAIITKSENTLVKYISENELEIYICPEMVDEIIDVLNHPKLKKHLKENVSTYIELIKTVCIYTKPDLHLQYSTRQTRQLSI